METGTSPTRPQASAGTTKASNHPEPVGVDSGLDRRPFSTLNPVSAVNAAKLIQCDINCLRGVGVMREIKCLRSDKSNCLNTHLSSECSSLSAGIVVNAPLNAEPAHTQFALSQPSLSDPLLANVVRNTSRHG